MSEPERGRVLIVDDEATVRQGFSRLLVRAGYKVFEAHDVEHAIALLGDTRFDVVLSDVYMPGMSGLDLLRIVRERDLDVPVMLITGTPKLDTITQAIEHGVLRFLTKPIDGAELVKQVNFAAHAGAMTRLRREALSIVGDVAKFVGDRAGLEVRFNRALEGLWMAYQPIVSFPAMRVYAYEALVRTTEPSLMSPPLLLDAAERLGRLPDLGRAIRAQVAAKMATNDELFFVNLHGADLRDEQLFAPASPLTKLASRVVLEITERAALDDVAEAVRQADDLRRLGFRMAIDDLGAGYAGLGWFAQLLPEIVKVDMSLVRDINSDLAKQRVVASIVSLCREVGMLLVAEGVETVRERDTLAQLGCEFLQGYFFGKPQRELLLSSALPS